jgi:MFS family permease
MGILGTAGAVGMAAGPAVGGMIANQFGLDAMFYCSAFSAFISIVIVLNVKETLSHKESFSLKHLKVSRHDLFEPLVIIPCMVMLLTYFSYGAVLTLLPDFGQHVGIKNKGLLFAFLTLASLLIRLIAGKASDRYGRLDVLLISTIIMTISMIVTGISSTPLLLIVGVSIYGLAQGSTSPTLLAWAIDLSHVNFKGRALASLYIFMELGIGLGAFLSGIIYSNDSSNFSIAFFTCAGLNILAFIYLIFKRNSYKKNIQ